MKIVLVLLLSAALVTLVVSQEDPTESLSGVYDLSKFHSILAVFVVNAHAVAFGSMCSNTLSCLNLDRFQSGYFFACKLCQRIEICITVRGFNDSLVCILVH